MITVDWLGFGKAHDPCEMRIERSNNKNKQTHAKL